MPWFSYHGGHSGSFCAHARDELEAVVERAARAGFTHYGLSEHAPRDRERDLYPEERERSLTPRDLAATFEAYAREAERLREAYAGRLELLVGFETERLPPERWVERMSALRAEGPFEYVVGSVHDVDGTWIDLDPGTTQELQGRLGGREALEVRYFEALAELVERVRPEVVGHVDLVRRFDPPGGGLTSAGLAAAEEVLGAARRVGAALDVNSGALRRGGPLYPCAELLARARAMDLPVTLGDDSHGVDQVGAGLEAALEAISRAGYERVHYLVRGTEGVEWRCAELGEVRP